MRMMRTFCATLTFFVSLAPTGVTGQSPVNAVCLRCVADSLHYHGVALIGDRNGVGQVEAFHRDGVPGRALTPEVSFNMGSMTKMFTAVAIGQLIESGDIGLNDPVRLHLPTLPAHYDGVRLVHLLQHTAGTGNYLTPANIDLIRQHRNTGDLLKMAIDGTLAFEPGTAYRYSNSGFILLGAVIEAASGIPYTEYVRTRIFEAAGMRGTSFEVPENSAKHYSQGSLTPGQPGTRPGSSSPSAREASSAFRLSSMDGVPGMPAGGAYTTAGDMYRFGVALLEHRLVNARTLAILTTPTSDLTTVRTTSGRTDVRYAHGFHIDGKYGTFGHGGGGPGINAEFRVQPTTGWIAVTLTNVDPPMASTMMVGLVQEMMRRR